MKKTQRPTPLRDERINLRVSQALRRKLVALARENGRTLSNYLERLLTEHVRSGDRQT